MKQFDDWFDEQVGYTIRCEWFFDDLEEHFRTGMKSKRMIEWLQAAYAAGREHALEPMQDDGK